MKYFTDKFLKEQYTLDFGAAGIDPPLVPTVNVPPWFSKECLTALLKQHPEAPFVTTWHRCADGNVEIRCRTRDIAVMDVGAFAREKFCGWGQGRSGRFHIHCSTISL